MPHLTYTFKILQTRGVKGRALHEAMSRYTTVVREFLDWAAEHIEDFDAASLYESNGRVRRSKRSLEKWVRQSIKILSTYAELETGLKDSAVANIAEQLISYLELREVQDGASVPTGRGASDLEFVQYMAEFTERTWIEDQPVNGQDDDFLRTQGKVQGYRLKQPYTPIPFCRYDPKRNYCLVKSEDGAYFALLFLLPVKEGSIFTRNGGQLTVVGKGVELKRVPPGAILAPLGMSKWVTRHLEQHQPRTAKLVYRDGDFYLHVAFDIPEAQKKPPLTILGVDRGKSRTASTAVLTLDGKTVITKGSILTLHQRRVNEITAKVAKAQAKGAQYRYNYRTLNEEAAHFTVNEVLRIAKRYKSKIVLESLESMMRANMAKSKSNFNRGRKSNVYARILKALEYKAAQQGIEVETVSAAYTSQTCPECGCVDKINRLVETGTDSKGGTNFTRLHFRCVECGFADDDADSIAGINIARKALFKKACIEAKKSGKSLTWREFAREICAR